MTKTQRFISTYKYHLDTGSEFFNPDTQLMSKDHYYNAKHRILVVFPTTYITKSVSMTAEALNSYFVENCPDVFLDFAYIPARNEQRMYDKQDIPYAIGITTHLDASHFDTVAFSLSIVSEMISASVILATFDRCDKPIPLTWSERKDLLCSDIPSICIGGILSYLCDLDFGTLPDGRIAYFDFAYLGECDLWGDMFKHYESNLTHLEYQCVLMENFPHVYQPQAYEVIYKDGIPISNKKINPRAQDYVIPHYPHKMSKGLGVARKIEKSTGHGAGVSEVQISEGCSGAGSCYFCSEGYYTGPWRELSTDMALAKAKQAKQVAGSYIFLPYSFNSNYKQDYTDLLYRLYSIFPRTSFINMRMDELGRDPQQLALMKYTGAVKFSAPIEGISHRVRNYILNKKLSPESINNFFDALITLPIMEVKIGIILTAYEADDDWHEFLELLTKYRLKTQAMGKVLSFRLAITPLVHYPGTPCFHIAHKSVEASYHERITMPDWVRDELDKLGIRYKIHGFPCSLFLEQSLLDRGRDLMPLIHKEFVEPRRIPYTLRTLATSEMLEKFKAGINPNTFFTERPLDKSISPLHRIRFDLMGSYLISSQRLLAAYGTPDAVTLPCLKTYDGCKVKCLSNQSVQMSLYSDVWLEGGIVTGSSPYYINGCESCQSNEEKVARFAHYKPLSKSLSDLEAMKLLQPSVRMRFTLNRNPEYDLLSPSNTAHTFVAHLLQCCPGLVDVYHSIDSHNFAPSCSRWFVDKDTQYTVSGLQVVDILLTEDYFVSKDIPAILSQVNETLQSTTITGCTSEHIDEALKDTDWNVYYYETTLPMDVIQTGCMTWDHKVEMKKENTTINVLDNRIPLPTVVTLGKVCGYFAIPAKHNPQLFFSSILSNPKVRTSTIRQKTRFRCDTVVRLRKSVCRCGVENSVQSVVTGKNLPFGLDCLVKALTKRLIGIAQ